MIHLIIVIIAIFPFSHAQALVDPSTGSFIHSSIDYEGQDLDLDLKFERTYNSRTTHRGWFGYGWCSDLESTVKEEEGRVIFNHCGDGALIVYLKKGPVYITDSVLDGIFQNSGSQWQRQLPGGQVEIFSSIGKLVEVKKGASRIVLRYDDQGFLKEILDGKGNKISIKKNSQNYITNIIFNSPSKSGLSRHQEVASYVYDHDNLISAKNIWQNTYDYQYDSDHNMIKALWPAGEGSRKQNPRKDRPFIKMTYNKNDWVTSIQGSDICLEKYDYQVYYSAKPTRFSVGIEKKCPKNSSIQKMYSYTYENQNERLLASEVESEGQKKEFKYDKQGRIIEITEYRRGRAIITKVTRNDEGFITQIKNDFESRKYKFKKGIKSLVPAEILIETLHEEKVINKYLYLLSFDSDDRLSGLKKPDGGFLNFKYGDFGVLSQIINDKLNIFLNYNAAFSQVISIQFNGKKLDLNIYEKKASDEEIEAVEMYFDFVRIQNLIHPPF